MAKLIGTNPNQVPTNADLGTMAYQDYDVVASQFLGSGNRNLIINGAMQVAQRGTSATSVTTGGYNTVDRFSVRFNATDELAVTNEQSTDAPTGFSNSYKLTVTTAEATLDADERLAVNYRIEGQDLQHLNYGTSDAESVTLSFYVKSNVTGTYGFLLQNRGAVIRSIGAAYIINTADTWEKKTITLSGDTAYAIINDNGERLRLTWTLAAGTDFTSGTLPTSFEDNITANNAPSNQVNIIDTISNYWQITGVQLEVGDTATPFEHRSYGEELLNCCRYYQKAQGMWGWTYNSSAAVFSWKPAVPFRASPSMGLTALASVDQPAIMNRTQSSFLFYTFNWSGNSGDHLNFQLDSFSGLNTNVMVHMRSSGGYTTWDAEL